MRHDDIKLGEIYEIKYAYRRRRVQVLKKEQRVEQSFRSHNKGVLVQFLEKDGDWTKIKKDSLVVVEPRVVVRPWVDVEAEEKEEKEKDARRDVEREERLVTLRRLRPRLLQIGLIGELDLRLPNEGGWGVPGEVRIDSVKWGRLEEVLAAAEKTMGGGA